MISRRLAAIGGELGRHGALNDMAAALLECSLVALLAIVTVSDLRTRLVPDAPLVFCLVLVLVVCAIAAPDELPERLAAGAAAAGFLLAAALIRPNGMGLGDVKLAGVIGAHLGTAVVEAMLVAVLSGSVVGLALLARHGWAARSRTIPFAPCLALGALVAMALGS
jgi:leader peptidase (prepilin peptidase) / N-methyltransferase